MKVTYLHHSGFMVELYKKVLEFDYYTQSGRFNFLSERVFDGKDLIFFASHMHEDHFDRRIGNWLPQAAFVLSDDIRMENAKTGNVLMVEAGKEYEFCDMEIKTLKSNDEGVAFLIRTEGKTIYHGGDLNWWHWNGEPDDFNNDIEKSYCGETNKLIGEKIDVAFVPADPRLEDKALWAVDYFMAKVGAKAVFPMHFWDQFNICEQLKEKPYGEYMMVINERNQSFELLE